MGASNRQVVNSTREQGIQTAFMPRMTEAVEAQTWVTGQVTHRKGRSLRAALGQQQRKTLLARRLSILSDGRSCAVPGIGCALRRPESTAHR